MGSEMGIRDRSKSIPVHQQVREQFLILLEDQAVGGEIQVSSVRVLRPWRVGFYLEELQRVRPSGEALTQMMLSKELERGEEQEGARVSGQGNACRTTAVELTRVSACDLRSRQVIERMEKFWLHRGDGSLRIGNTLI